MSLSSVVLNLAARSHVFGRSLTWLWAGAYGLWPGEPHWVFRELRRRHRVEASRTVRLRTGEWCCVDPFDDIGGEIAENGCYEPETVEVFLHLVGPGMTIVDAGANVGQYTLISSTLVGDSGRIFAFEPEPRNYARLLRNVRLNAKRNVTVEKLALSDAAGELTFHLACARNSGAHSLAPTIHSDGATTTVRVTTLDEYAAAKNIDRVDLLKADVEGAELLLLRGAAKVLERDRPTLVLEASTHARGFGYEPADLCNHIETLGYAVFLQDPRGLLPLHEHWPERRDAFNIVGVPVERVGELAALLQHRDAGSMA